MTESKRICGIVMPISAIDGCDEGHWNDVYEILKEAVILADFEGNLVSYADDVGIIQKRIIQNLYDNPIVVCDVSGKNPNVMFELGMRLAFDKPTIIIKDDRTSYSFDTSPIEHLEYPRDLRFSKIVEFKEKLAHKIRIISQKSTESAAYSPFLQHFGEFKVAKIDQKEVSGQEYIIDELKSIKLAMARLDRRNIMSDPLRRPAKSRIEDPSVSTDICLGGKNSSNIIEVIQKFLVESSDIIKEFEFYSRGEEHSHLIITVYNPSDLSTIKQKISSLLGRKRRPINSESEN
ncbi:hypothetical protein KVY11_10060 [Acinetobacter sp. CWB-G5]|uniref:hypothetical protein n=1 Tax=Acinetobacter sp. CWB-G5 TaxID=2855444 RepID=UPI001C443076|nr:hypothetical protein [Acinetobacter sp. CWB-G5]MBV7309022.1 hypothetical protein [Acinetobacter sp. CWB-G5]